jgi:hypothetical protein
VAPDSLIPYPVLNDIILLNIESGNPEFKLIPSPVLFEIVLLIIVGVPAPQKIPSSEFLAIRFPMIDGAPDEP